MGKACNTHAENAYDILIGSCEHDNEPSGSIQLWEILE
jgi:hypothetical protein